MPPHGRDPGSPGHKRPRTVEIKIAGPCDRQGEKGSRSRGQKGRGEKRARGWDGMGGEGVRVQEGGIDR